MTPETHTRTPDPLLRLYQVIGRKAKGRNEAVPALIPISRSAWLAGVKAGKYPKPVRLGRNTVAWRASDISAVAAKGGGK